MNWYRRETGIIALSLLTMLLQMSKDKSCYVEVVLL
jgi:hypothetical protein